jgi:hypothetical protein
MRLQALSGLDPWQLAVLLRVQPDLSVLRVVANHQNQNLEVVGLVGLSAIRFPSNALEQAPQCETGKILLAPEQARHCRDNIVFERSDGAQLGNELVVQFPEGHRILAGKDASRGIGPVLKGGGKFFDPN